jgi:hypothetical protein
MMTVTNRSVCVPRLFGAGVADCGRWENEGPTAATDRGEGVGMTDPTAIDTILVALGGAAVAGGLEAVKDTTKATITTAVAGFRDLIRGRLGDAGDHDGSAEVTIYTKRPTHEGEEAVRHAIANAGLDADPEIIYAARQVLQIIGPAAVGSGAIAGAVNQTISGQGVGFVGGLPTVTINQGQTARTAAWDLIPVRAIAYELRNTGRGDAHDVDVSAEGVVRFDPPEGLRLWPAGVGRTLHAGGSWQTGHPTVTVSWSDTPGGARRTWSRPVPS